MDAREPWPCSELLEDWLGDPSLGDSMYDLQFHPGESIVVDADDPAAVHAARHFRDVLGRFASGVTVVTAVDDGTPVGLTCQSFSSVSLDPPLVLFVPSRASRAWPAIRRSGSFCVNFLADGQQTLSNQMASRGEDKFAGVGWRPAPATGSPLLEGTLGYVDCRIHAVHEAGDHDVVIGRVLDLGGPDEGGPEHPLLFFRGQYDSTRGQDAQL